MTQLEREPVPVDMDTALADPAACFARPMDVVEHPELAAEFKLKLLRQWERDARLRTHEHDSDAKLARVREALRTLEGTGASIADTARAVAGGIAEAAGQVQHAAVQTRAGVAGVRQFIRAQPIAAGLLIFGCGYLSGRVAAALSGDDRR